MINPYVSLTLTFLAVARVSKLVTTDYISLPIRQWVLRKNGETGWITHGLHCDLCVSVWGGFIAAPLWYFYGTRAWYVIPMLAMAMAYFVCIVKRVDI